MKFRYGSKPGVRVPTPSNLGTGTSVSTSSKCNRALVRGNSSLRDSISSSSVCNNYFLSKIILFKPTYVEDVKWYIVLQSSGKPSNFILYSWWQALTGNFRNTTHNVCSIWQVVNETGDKIHSILSGARNNGEEIYTFFIMEMEERCCFACSTTPPRGPVNSLIMHTVHMHSVLFVINVFPYVNFSYNPMPFLDNQHIWKNNWFTHLDATWLVATCAWYSS